ncbi:S26 family signal peptidase [Micromonospora sp. NPDC023888]|uniref:S26 family signal peptidase n=1 Tax=Micromonospora sp. NPDC023888 TaxID=3155607 RepID=UPI0034070C38
MEQTGTPHRHDGDQLPGPPAPASGRPVRVRRSGRPHALDVPPLLGLVLVAAGTVLTVAGPEVGWVRGSALLAAVVGAGIGLLAMLARRLAAVTVRGVSMQPAFHDGDRVLVRRTTKPRVGQVVVVEQPTPDGRWRTAPLPTRASPSQIAGRRWMIKRVVALPGDPIPPGSALRAVAGGRIPPGRLALLGDNRSASLDSRQLGYFPMARVLGTVRRRLNRTRWTEH